MFFIRRISHQKYLLILAILFSLEWIALAIAPLDRKDWALENVLVVFFVFVLGLTYKRFPFSRISYTLFFLFLCIHEIGAHYTYAEVPYDAWCQHLMGFSFNDLVGWERNNFDRIVHFSYGLLLAYPMREVYFRIARAFWFWGYFLPLDFTMSTSMLFELFEWMSVGIFAGDLGVAYLGTQGDVWDAQKDMALASLGAFISMFITLCLNVKLQKDFAREWAESLKIKYAKPLGEDEMFRLWKRRTRKNKKGETPGITEDATHRRP
jgi:putative membrane protein